MIDKLQGKPNISVMAEFTIYDQLKVINVDLNIPPFMEDRGQLPAAEVLERQKIASLHVHIERVIGRIKNYTIFKGTLPITLSCDMGHVTWIRTIRSPCRDELIIKGLKHLVPLSEHCIH